MEANRRRNIRSGTEYDRLFPRSENGTKTIRKNANVDHTVAFIPKVVQDTLDQTKQIAHRLKGRTTYETCSNIWHFVYQHINYKKDQEGYEQIRSPSRAWHDRKAGVDCDCYSVFISSILTNLSIPHILRITKYHRDYFQHIYPVVPLNEKNITIDCVTDKFDYEVPFSEKKDYPMELQYLNGFDGDGMGELGNILKKALAKKAAKVKAKVIKKAANTNPKPASLPIPSAPPPKQKKGIFKKVLNVVNKVNPATVLLRNGVLAAMKLNIKNVAQRLRWSYLSAEQAAAKGIEPTKFQKLLATRQKLEKIFYGAGGKEDNLKKAILGGKGNKDKAVSGLGMLPMIEWAGYMNEYTPLKQLLGPEIFYAENVEGMEGFQGFGELGEPLTITAVGAAMGVIAGIVASLKQVGDIFKTKQKGSEDFNEENTEAPENNVALPPSPTPVPLPVINPPALPIVVQDTAVPIKQDYSNSEKFLPQQPIIKTPNYPFPTSDNSSLPSQMEMDEEPGSLLVPNSSNTFLPTATEPNNTGNSTTTGKQGFWEKNKTWLKPVAIGAGGLTLIAIGFKLMKGSRPPNKSSPRPGSLSGVPKRKKKKKSHLRRRKPKHTTKKAVALL